MLMMNYKCPGEVKKHLPAFSEIRPLKSYGNCFVVLSTKSGIAHCAGSHTFFHQISALKGTLTTAFICLFKYTTLPYFTTSLTSPFSSQLCTDSTCIHTVEYKSLFVFTLDSLQVIAPLPLIFLPFVFLCRGYITIHFSVELNSSFRRDTSEPQPTFLFLLVFLFSKTTHM